METLQSAHSSCPLRTRAGNPPTHPPHGSAPRSLCARMSASHTHTHRNTQVPKSPQSLHLDRKPFCSSLFSVTRSASRFPSLAVAGRGPRPACLCRGGNRVAVEVGEISCEAHVWNPRPRPHSSSLDVSANAHAGVSIASRPLP